VTKTSSTIPLPPLPPGAPGRPANNRYKEQYGVIVLVATSDAQKDLFEGLFKLGFKCRVVTT